jgi:hypothetical protein
MTRTASQMPSLARTTPACQSPQRHTSELSNPLSVVALGPGHRHALEHEQYGERQGRVQPTQWAGPSWPTPSKLNRPADSSSTQECDQY